MRYIADDGRIFDKAKECIEYEVDRLMTEIDIEKLLHYIHEEFPQPMSNHFTYDLVGNIICYAVDNLPSDMVLYFIAEMIPEVEVDELVAVLDEE